MDVKQHSTNTHAKASDGLADILTHFEGGGGGGVRDGDGMGWGGGGSGGRRDGRVRQEWVVA